MSRIPLLGGAYRDRSLIASAQETINLIPEKNTNAQAPAPVTHYLTPGTRLFATPPVQDNSRCCYTTSLGTCYTVVGVNIYFVATNGAMVLIGSIPDRESQVIMADNGLVLILVDGVDGFAIDLVTNDFGIIVDAAFPYGASTVAFLDTFFIFNRPNTNQFYISLSMVDYSMLIGGTAFDPLDTAAKSGSADPIVGIVTVHKELWLIGSLTTEVWIGTGAADFYFQLIQGMYIDHGCSAAFSITYQDVLVFWLMQDKQGQYQIMKGVAGEVSNIATSYLTDLMSKMIAPTNVITGVWAQNNHAFLVVNWVTDNITFVWDLTTQEWFRWTWLDENGNINRHRANTFAFFNKNNLIGDWETGKLYVLDPNVYTDLKNDGDNEGPILRRKTFLHMVGNDFERVNYIAFDADIEVGTSTSNDPDNPPMINLFWSDDRGKTYGNAVQQSMGLQGEYLTVVSWNRLGQARDRIFKLEWAENLPTSLLGGFAQVRAARS